METTEFTLDAKYVQESGTVLLTGIQALVRLPMDQHRADRRRGLRTATFISGYQGSPLGTLDMTIQRSARLLQPYDVHWVPGINEDLAATAVWGSQQEMLGELKDRDGVLGMWYGKGPGVDRCGDVFKHANFLGTAANGGVLAVGGDDPIAKSSTMPMDAIPTFYDAMMPVLYPGTVQEVLDLGLHGFALSRYSGLWVGFKIVTNIADGLETIEVGEDRVRPQEPSFSTNGAAWRHVQREGLLAPISLEQEKEIFYQRLEAAKAYAAHNGLNEITLTGPDDRVGIIAPGRTYYELRQALHDLGLTDDDLRGAGVRLLRLGMVYPLEEGIVRRFADGLEELLVLEEKRPFVELFVKDALYGMASAPRVVGKHDERQRPLVPADGELTADRLAPLLADHLAARVSTPEIADRRVQLAAPQAVASSTLPVVARTPYFCSGCPHNRSTNAPDGSLVGAGVGCHAMVMWMDRGAVSISHMGGEGAHWIGRAPFTDTPHFFQNLGDGTFFHSGSLAVRAAVAAGVNITYKLLYNQAVAMTGGQAVAGVMDVPELTRALHAEGVSATVVCSDDPSRFGRRAAWAPGTEVLPRDELDAVQSRLQQVEGVSVIIYDQECAAETRRARKRGRVPTPRTRVFINELVCEGCGDCGVKSNCLSVQPIETTFGPKTQIHQASCNLDFTCLEGDCPSFVKVELLDDGLGAPRSVPQIDHELPEPDLPTIEDTYSVYMTGIGGTGVVTVSQVLATAALLDGRAVTGLDQTGLSQKGGPVVSHLRVSAEKADRSPIVGAAQAGCYLGFDLVVAVDPKNVSRIGPQTQAVLSTSQMATGDMVSTPQSPFPDVREMISTIMTALDSPPLTLDATGFSEVLFGDHMPANLIVLGAAYQAGQIPVSAGAIERAITLNGVAVESNLAAFRWGRLYALDQRAALAVVSGPPSGGSLEPKPTEASMEMARGLVTQAALPDPVAELTTLRAAELVDYQARPSLAREYIRFVSEVAHREGNAQPGRTELAEAVARGYFKLLAYKDEYEVARLILRPEVDEALAAAFPGRIRARPQLHPPVLRAMGLNRKIGLGGPLGRVVLRVLAALRRVRGTRLDLFGRTAMRRLERELIGEYRSLIADELDDLASDGGHARAVRLAELPDVIRGYEDIKLRNVERFREEVERLKSPPQLFVTLGNNPARDE